MDPFEKILNQLNEQDRKKVKPKTTRPRYIFEPEEIKVKPIQYYTNPTTNFFEKMSAIEIEQFLRNTRKRIDEKMK